MKRETYKDIAKFTNKTEGTIKHWKRINPDLLKLCKIGAFCKKNEISIEDIESLVKLKDIAEELLFEVKSGMTMDVKTFKKHFEIIDKRIDHLPSYNVCIDRNIKKEWCFIMHEEPFSFVGIIDPKKIENINTK